MRSVALDVHLDFCEVAIVEDGELRSAGRIETKPEQIELFASSLAPDDRVALEVTGNAWEIARIIEPHVARVLVVSPSDTGIRQARAKTDRLDARTLARLLAAGSLDGVWVPDRWTWMMRRRLSRRSQLVWARSRAKNQVHAVLMRQLVGRPPFSDVFGVKGRQWLSELKLAPEESETVGAAMRQIEFFDSEISPATSGGSAGAPVRRLTRDARAHLKAGLHQGAPRAGRGVLDDGAPARSPSRLLSAHPSTPRALCGDRRGRAQARVPVLVSAHPRRGLRLPAALADQEEAQAS